MLTKKKIFLYLFTFLCLVVQAQTFESEHARVSLLTTTPCDNAVYTLYGHTSIRIRDSIAPDKTIDYVFNYGQFDASQPHFEYHFAKGDLDYSLAYYAYDRFANDRELPTAMVYEQILNLTSQEMRDLWNALIINYQPENRLYRYNYFFDNCATRPANLIEQIINGTVIYEENHTQATFRDIINDLTKDSPWLTFGCDLVLGLPTDRIVTFRESFFVPEFLQKAFSSAQIIDPDGTKRPLVKSETVLIEKVYEGKTSQTFFTPLVCCLTLFILISYITWFEWRRKKYFRMVDCVLFLIAGMAGCIIFFLCFLSDQPSIRPNLSIVWLHPFHLVGVVLFAIKKWNKAAYFYHFINFVAILLMSVAWIFIPQHMNNAFIPLIAILLLRSGYGLVREKVNIR
ncbi:MAG: DUF4105 domain-containing protein [Tannerella sp.]|jgi:hypothetical protein|nr:DUF4105 domain-containing protein [Tannerella sp.]